MKKYIDGDMLGVIASVVCLEHWLCLPWILAISGAWLGSYFTSPWFHHFMLAVAFLIGVPIFLRSFFKYRSYFILVTGITGLSLTAFGTFKTGDTCCPPLQEVACGDSSCEDSQCEVKDEACADEACADEACADSKSSAEDKACTDEACKDAECSKEGKADTTKQASEDSTSSTEAKAAPVAESDCADCESCEEETAVIEEEPELKEPTEVQEAGFNFVPLGVFLLIVAHAMNFSHRKKCSKPCCPSNS